ncbi:MAG: FtsX-like permease family protein [Sphaerochaetaceae bacterium]
MFKMAFRSLFRYGKRTAITVFAISIGVALAIFTKGVLIGVDLDSTRNLIKYETGGAKVFPKGYFEDMKYFPVDKFIEREEKEEIFKKISELDKDIKFTGEFISSGEVMFYEDPFPASGSVKAIIHTLPYNQEVYEINKDNLEGSWLEKNSDEVVIGSKLADDMKAKIGYYLTIQSRGRDGFLQAFDVKIGGILNTGNPVIDASAVYVDMDFTDSLFELNGGVNSIVFNWGNDIVQTINQTTDKVSIIRAIASSLGDFETYDWEDLSSDLIALQKTKDASSGILLFFLFIIATVGITNTMLMAVSERKNEIAMLRALGYKGSYIKSLFAIEGGLIGAIGAICGAILGLLIVWPCKVYGIDFSSLMGDMDIGYRINAIMYAAIDMKSIILIVLFAFGVSVLSAWIAVRHSSKGEISEIMRRI